MVAPQLDTEHPGIRVIAEVASVLQAGSASGVALRGVVGALRRGLNLRRCRLWLRTPDGTRYAPVTTPGDEAELRGSDHRLAPRRVVRDRPRLSHPRLEPQARDRHARRLARGCRGARGL